MQKSADEHDALPFAETEAAQMLARGFKIAHLEEGVSMRQLAKRMGYKQGVVLSHMATGRVPIPLERSLELADLLHLDREAFLKAVLKQRYPAMDWAGWSLASAPAEEVSAALISDLTQLAGMPLDEIDPNKWHVLREAVSDQQPLRRWLTVHEVATMELIRSLRPAITRHGLTLRDQTAIRVALLAEEGGTGVDSHSFDW